MTPPAEASATPLLLFSIIRGAGVLLQWLWTSVAVDLKLLWILVGWGPEVAVDVKRLWTQLAVDFQCSNVCGPPSNDCGPHVAEELRCSPLPDLCKYNGFGRVHGLRAPLYSGARN